MVKVGGERVGCDEVAAVLRGAAGVSDAAVVAIRDETYGARLIGVYTEPVCPPDLYCTVAPETSVAT